MNLETLRGLVIELRDREGMTFQNIADTIEEKYGVVRTRQSIQGMYKRAKKDIERSKSIDSTEEYLFIGDVINLEALGYFSTEIRDELKLVYSDVKYNRIRDIVRDNQNEIEEIRKGITERVRELIPYYNFYRELESQIVYKEWGVKDRALRRYVKDAYKDRIVSKVRDELRKLEGFIDDGVEVTQLKEELKKVQY